MKKNFIFKFLISIFILNFFILKSFSTEKTFVSISPALTEIMYAINAQNSLKGVSTTCNYPKEAKLKEKVGNNFFINEEKILKIKPNYILALDSSEFALKKFEKFNIKPLCFKYPNIQGIYNNILTLGELTNKNNEAKQLVKQLQEKITKANKHHNHTILYLVQTTPMISIGKKSFITDIIEKSGNKSITANINSYYPAISEEFAITQKPDVIVLGLYSDAERLKKLFPKSKIIYITKEETDIISRPGSRIDKSVDFFAKL